MDRVLLIIDDIQYSRHVEMTLRKVGFDVESINNEFNINETILTFNPNFTICRGSSSRLSSLSVGRKLKDANTKYNGKSILIFSEGFKVAPDDLINLKMDLLLFEPISTLRLAMHLSALAEGNFELVKEKLLKFAITDSQFRNYEQQMLKNMGLTIDAEIQVVSGMDYSKPDTKQEEQEEQVDKPKVVESDNKAKPQFEEPAEISNKIISEINDEIKLLEQELPLRLDTYNRIINKIDQDLSVGLKKKQTRKVSYELQKSLLDEGLADEKIEQEHNDSREDFVKALFKKK